MSNNELILVGASAALLLAAAVYLIVAVRRSGSIDSPRSGNGRAIRVFTGLTGLLFFLAALASFAAEATDEHPHWGAAVRMLLLSAAVIAITASSLRLTVIARKGAR